MAESDEPPCEPAAMPYTISNTEIQTMTQSKTLKLSSRYCLGPSATTYPDGMSIARVWACRCSNNMTY